MTVTIEFAPGTANEKTLNLSADASQLNPVRVHTGVSDVRGTIKGDRSLEQYAKRQDRINIKSDGETIWTGYAVGISHNIQSGQTTISGDGIGKRLEETKPDYESIGGPVTYSNIALHDALRDYWGRTPFNNVTVTDQDTELVTEDEQIQSADTNSDWDSVTPTIASTDPLTVSSGELRVLQTCFTRTTDDATSVNTFTRTADDAEGGGEFNFVSSGQYAEWSFTNDHEIPADQFAVALRGYLGSDASDVGGTFVDVELDGSAIGSVAVQNSSYEWVIEPIGLSEGLSTGNHTIRISPNQDVTPNGTEDEEGQIIDMCAPHDGRYNYNFDNSLNSDNLLDGPELYPVGIPVALDDTTTSFNIAGASVASTWNGTTNNQIRVTNDNGDNYKSVSGSDSLSVDFNTAGRQTFVEISLGRFGSRDTRSPRKGFNGHAIDSYSLSIDGDNLVVIVDMELMRNHFDNLKTLHEFGDFLWTIEHDDGPISDMAVSSFRRGEETRPAPDGFSNQVNQRPEIQSGSYFNSVYLEGAKRDDGTRPTATEKDQEAINNDDREISPGVLRDTTITTDAGANFRAQALLDAALSNNDLVGSVTVPPVMVHPGYSRPVDFGPGEDDKTVEKVSLSLSQNNAEATFDFTSRTGLVEDIESLKRDTKGLGNQV